jgi:hypothetical protein
VKTNGIQLEDRAAKSGSATADGAGAIPKDHKQKTEKAQKGSGAIPSILEVTVRTQQSGTSAVRRKTVKKMFFHRVVESELFGN